MNSNVYKTLHLNDPEFQDYLWGRGVHLRQQTRPIPVETLNLGTSDEIITFKVLKKSEIKRPAFFKFVADLIKLKSFILILMPLFYVLVKNYSDDRITDPFSVTLASVAMIFLYAGLNIRNDVSDHIYGYDRVNASTANKPITLGWISAQQASTLSWILIIVSAFIAGPIFLLQKELIQVISVLLVLFILGQFIKKNAYKSNRFGEIILFLLVGPGVLSGYQVSLGAGIDTECLAFGVLWSFAILFLIHINNFRHLLTSSQARIKNTITQMGFDKAQKFLIVWWSIYCVLWLTFHILYASQIWTVFGTLLLVLWSLPLLNQISKIKSPVGSDLEIIRKKSYNMFLMMVLILFVENFWYLGIKLNWTL